MNDLRTVLRLDALASGALGVLLLAGFGPAESELGLAVPVSLGVGVLLLVWAGSVLAVSRTLARTWVVEVIALNLGYVVASVVFALAADLTGLGTSFVLVQALAVLGFAALQARALRARALREGRTDVGTRVPA